MDEKLRDALVFLKNRILTSPPRLVNCERPGLIHVYTDACQDEDYSGIGGLAYDSLGNIIGYFSQAITSLEISQINLEDKKTVIAELESLAVLAGLGIFCEHRVGYRIVGFIDNEATLSSMIKADSPVPFLSDCAEMVAELESKLGLDVWFERVASNANPADLPFRGETEHLTHVPRMKTDIPSLLKKLRNNLQE